MEKRIHHRNPLQGKPTFKYIFIFLDQSDQADHLRHFTTKCAKLLSRLHHNNTTGKYNGPVYYLW